MLSISPLSFATPQATGIYPRSSRINPQLMRTLAQCCILLGSAKGSSLIKYAWNTLHAESNPSHKRLAVALGLGTLFAYLTRLSSKASPASQMLSGLVATGTVYLGLYTVSEAEIEKARDDYTRAFEKLRLATSWIHSNASLYTHYLTMLKTAPKEQKAAIQMKLKKLDQEYKEILLDWSKAKHHFARCEAHCRKIKCVSPAQKKTIEA